MIRIIRKKSSRKKRSLKQFWESMISFTWCYSRKTRRRCRRWTKDEKSILKKSWTTQFWSNTHTRKSRTRRQWIKKHLKASWIFVFVSESIRLTFFFCSTFLWSFDSLVYLFFSVFDLEYFCCSWYFLFDFWLRLIFLLFVIFFFRCLILLVFSSSIYVDQSMTKSVLVDFKTRLFLSCFKHLSRTWHEKELKRNHENDHELYLIEIFSLWIS